MKLPIALSIAGSDSGGGAGIQADLKTFASLKVHGTSVITCLTAQNPNRIIGMQPCRPAMVRAQLAAVFEELPPLAVKTGMLFSSAIIREVAAFLACARKTPLLIVDPVMVATSGSHLIEPKAIDMMKKVLLPMATLVTPNLAEAEALTGFRIRRPEDLRKAARELQQKFGCATLVKGGHITDSKTATDIFCDGKTELMLSAPFIRGIATHGTGCLYSAAIAAYCALGCNLVDAVRLAKNYTTRAIAQSISASGHSVLNSFWNFGMHNH